MREIKFRGIRKENDKWVYGNYAIVRMYVETDDLDLYERNGVSLIIKNNANCEVFCGITGYEEVYANTLGQFTGLYDKNGKEIYEGDIVDDSETELIYVIEFICGEFVGINEECGIGRIMNSLSEDGEVIGNIHDNPELLEREGN